MATNLGNWFLAGIQGVSAASLGKLALGYLAVSLLATLSWVCLVEICRRTQMSQAYSRKRHRIVVRLALPIAKLENPVSPTWLLESRPEQG
jgi:hypothetical protein